MSLRPVAKENEFLDAAVELLGQIASMRDEYSGPVPQSVGRVYSIEYYSGATPALAVQTLQEESEGLVSNELHGSWFQFFVHVVTDDPNTGDAGNIELAADVKKHLLSNMRALLVNRGLDVNEVEYLGAMPYATLNALQGKVGRRMHWRVYCRWRHTAP